MSSTLIRSIEVAEEPVYMNPDANGVPTEAGLTFYAMTFELAGAPDPVGAEVPVDEDGTAHDGPFTYPPEAGVPWLGGARVRRQAGALSITSDVRGFGGGNGVIPNGNKMPLAMIWASSLHLVDTGGAEFAPLTGSANGKQITVTTGTTLAPGEVVSAVIDGCVIYNRVTDITVSSTDTVVFQLAWPRQLTTADRLQRGLNFQARTGVDMGSVGPTVAIRYKTQRATMVAYGCRFNDLTIAPMGETGKLQAVTAIQSEFITSSITSSPQAIAEAPRLAAQPANLQGTDLLVSTDNVRDAAAPVSAASRRPVWEFKSDWEFKLTPSLEVIGGGCIRGSTNLEVTGYACTFKYHSKAPYHLDQHDREDGVMRALAHGGAPTNDGTTKLNGWGFSIPAGYLETMNHILAGGTVEAQTRTYKAGLYKGDSPASNVNVAMYLGGT